MAEQIAYNVDCMEYMKTVPDKYFDLAVVDPPYGDGCSQIVNVERERAGRGAETTGRDSGDASTDTANRFSRKVLRTGGTWAAKFTKKLLRGM